MGQNIPVEMENNKRRRFGGRRGVLKMVFRQADLEIHTIKMDTQLVIEVWESSASGCR